MAASSRSGDSSSSILDHPAYTEAVERIRVLEDDIRWQNQRFDAVMRIGRTLGGTFDLDELLRTLMEHATALLGAERASLFLVDRERDEVWSKLMLGDGTSMERICMPLGKGIVGWVAQKGEVVNIADAYKDDRFNSEIDRQTGYRTRSILCVPMFDRGQHVMGAVQVLNKRRGVFDHEDELLLGAVVGQTAISVENSRLYKDLVERNRDLVEAEVRLRHKMAELDVLYEVERRISAATRLQDILDVILEKCCEVIGAEAGAILLREGDGGELFFKAVTGERHIRVKRLRLAPGSGIAGRVVKDGRPCLVRDVKEEPAYDPALENVLGFETHSIVAAPLVAGERTIGAIEILNSRSKQGFGQEDLKLITLIAGQASRAIAISRSREEEDRAERMTLLGQMMGAILHDLRTPMTVISGHAQLMAQEEEGSARERHCEVIFKQFDHIGAMTQEVMAFARGKRQILVRRVYLHKFIEQVRDLLKLDLEAYSVTLSVEANYKGVARFDENKMTRVISNIARNACQAMHGKGGGNFKWVVDCDEAEELLVFTFSDDGPGIPEEMEGCLFDSFSTHGKQDGTGLGLAIVKKIVEEHGGSVSSSSRPNEGATFRVTLPLLK